MRVKRAREALDQCTPEERAAIFRDVGTCGCSSIASMAKRNPGMAAGAVLGALAGYLLESSPKTPSLDTSNSKQIAPLLPPIRTPISNK